MPRIDPLQLLKCLRVLLNPAGGIKSKDEVQRLANLMTKFSKKLVSKCIYVSILRSTDTDLLVMFMSAGGWDLIYTWLSDGLAANNWPLVKEILDLLLICPVNIERLKTNACPKLVKTLSKDTSADEIGRQLACQLVDQWLKVVRGESEIATTNAEVKEEDEVIEIKSSSSHDVIATANEEIAEVKEDVKSEPTTGDSQLPKYKITFRDGKRVLAEVGSEDRASVGRSSVDDSDSAEVVNDEDSDNDIKPVKVSKKCYVNRTKVKKPLKIKNDVLSRDSVDSSSSTSSIKSFSKVNEEKMSVKKRKSPLKSKTKTTVNKEKDGVSKEKAINKKVSKSSSSEKKEAEKTIEKDKKDISVFGKDRMSKDNSDKEKKDNLLKKERTNKEKSDKELQEEREFKESISKIITPSISKLGKIPKKSGNKEEDDTKKENTKVLGSFDIKKSEIRKPLEIKKPEKKYSMSVETKRHNSNEVRPKTVKTFNSKFRSTGLEETPPPPPKPVSKKNAVVMQPVPTITFPDRRPIKRTSPSPPDTFIPEKKTKPDSPLEEKKLDKAGGIKLIPPKPKPMFLEESDVFMNALTAANLKEPRKRKRRPSVGKDGPSDAKKELNASNSTPPSSPLENDDKSPPIAKPTFKFYQDTLDTSEADEEKEKTSKPESEESLQFAQPEEEDSDISKERALSPPIDLKSSKPDVYNKSGGLVKGVLVHLKSRKGPKKSVCWKEEKDLEEIKYFEMDETERVNVTKNFLDMKQMERFNERENFQMARKLAVEDIMEEKVRWKAMIPCDSSGAAVISGKNSIEKDIQYAREKTVAVAFYFNKRAIPDSPSEPDLEIHATTDPAMIPLEDVTGLTDSVNDFTSTPWPEPQAQAPAPPQPEPVVQPLPVQQIPPQPYPPPQGPPGFGPSHFPSGPPGFMTSQSQLPPGDWRTGDGKILPVPELYQPQSLLGPMGPPMMPQTMIPPHGPPPDMGFPMGMPGPPGPMDERGHFGHPYSMGPNMGPGLLSPPYQPQGPLLQGPMPPQDYPGNSNDRFRNDDHAGRGNWYSTNGPGSYAHNKGNHRGNWRGGMDRRDNRDGRDSAAAMKTWGCNSRGICNSYIKRGFCKNRQCHFRHPSSK